MIIGMCSLLATCIHRSYLAISTIHRSGKECWLDWFGVEKPNFRGWLRDNAKEDWEARIALTPTRAARPWPESDGRDICRYMSEESEVDGLRVYMEWALAIYFRPFYQFWADRQALENNNTADEPKTIHICYEDEMKDFHGTIQRISTFFHVPRETTSAFKLRAPDTSQIQIHC